MRGSQLHFAWPGAGRCWWQTRSTLWVCCDPPLSQWICCDHPLSQPIRTRPVWAPHRPSECHNHEHTVLAHSHSSNLGAWLCSVAKVDRERALMKHKTNHQHLCSVTPWMLSGEQLFSRWLGCASRNNREISGNRKRVACFVHRCGIFATGDRDWCPEWPLHHRVTATVHSVSAAAPQQTEGQENSLCHTDPGLWQWGAPVFQGKQSPQDHFCQRCRCRTSLGVSLKGARGEV